MDKISQKRDIICHLRAFKGIDWMTALNRYGIGRLAARIYDLREEGYTIKTLKVEKNGKRYGVYHLIKEPKKWS